VLVGSGPVPLGWGLPYLRVQPLAALDELCLPHQRAAVRHEYGLYAIVEGYDLSTLATLCTALDARFADFEDPVGANGRPLSGQRIAPEPLLQLVEGQRVYSQRGIRVEVWVEVS
jgi:hypothetical protein